MYGIFTYIYHKKSTIHVGKYTSPVDPVGIDFTMVCGGRNIADVEKLSTDSPDLCVCAGT